MQVLKKNKGLLLIILLWTFLVPAIAYISADDLKMSVAVFGGIIGLALCLICTLNTRAGFYIFITVTLTIRLFERMSGAEQSVGVVMDGLLLCTLLGTILNKRDKTTDRSYLKDPLLWTLYAYSLYLCLQLFNPNVYSTQGWFIFMRVYLRNMIYIYLALRIFNTREDVKIFFKYWLVICTLAALYACLQQWLGLLPFEKVYIARYPEKFRTVVIMAGIRIFSFMSDPAVFGIIMSCNVILCLVLLTAESKTISYPKKALLLISMILQMMALGFSGTRTGYVMLPLGLVIFFLANMQKRNTILAAIVFTVAALAILYGPFYGNATIVRVRTAFIGKQDESMDVRDNNRHRIQPYIYKHPLGGGLMTTGGDGVTFNPGHPLADFQTDNGYLRTVLETGWLGLLLVALNFFLLIQGAVGCYFRSTDDLTRLLMISIAAISFAMAIAQVAQDAAGLVETALLMNTMMAIVVKMKHLSSI